MNFLTQQQEVSAQLGVDLTDSNMATLIKRWLNIIQQDIASRWPWPFLLSREVIQTVTDKTAGTVSVTSGTATVTGVGTSFVSGDVGKFIQFAGANDWYKVSAFTSATSITIESNYAPTTDLSAGKYVLRKIFYSLSSSADTIYDIRNYNTPLKLFQTDPMTLDEAMPNPQSTNAPSAFVTYGYDSSGNLQISPYPFPSDARNFEVRTWTRLSDLSADTDTTTIPTKWHHAMVYGANFLGFAWLRKMEFSKQWELRYEDKLVDMIRKHRTSEDELPVLNAIDWRVRGQFQPLPGNYPIIR